MWDSFHPATNLEQIYRLKPVLPTAMLTKLYLKLIAVSIAVAFLLCLAIAWRAERREHAQLQQQIATAEQALQQANARQQARDTSTKQQIAQLQKQARSIQKPADILKAFPQVLPLPVPLTFNPVPPVPVASSTGHISDNPSPNISLPVQDLKPLYDSAIACKECQVELATAQADLKDEQVKGAALSRERDDALRAAKGGSVLRRVTRAAKWFALGAAAGAVAAKLSR
jgi:type II secretory pathway pseudopilin PulG